MFGFVDGLVGLDEDGRALALHCDSCVVVEDVASFCEVPVPPYLQVCLAPQPGGNLVEGTHTNTHAHANPSAHRKANARRAKLA